MKLSVRDLINSESYDGQATRWSKVSIFVAYLVCAYFSLFTDYSLGGHWLWVLPVLLFASSLLLGAPGMLINVWLTSLFSSHATFIPGQGLTINNNKGRVLKLIRDLWVFIAIALEILIVYKFLEYVSQI